MSSEILFLAIVALFLIGLIKGGIKTFKRSIAGALICMLFLSPIWVIWAFVELFTGDIKKTGE